jgi:hypothetical protein
MSDNIIPIVRHAPSRAVLRESFFEVNDQIVHLIVHLRDAADHDEDRFFGLCDELRSQISEILDICGQGAQQGLFSSEDAEEETLRTLTMMVSHMELMFLYARKNKASLPYYRKEITITAEEFVRRHSGIAASLS